MKSWTGAAMAVGVMGVSLTVAEAAAPRPVGRTAARLDVGRVVDSRDTTELDAGEVYQRLLSGLSVQLYGVGAPLLTPASATNYVARENADVAGKRVKLAGGLTATYVSRKVAVAGDMIAFWPNNVDYTHLIVCIEQGRTTSTTPQGLNSGVQRIDVATGEVETILYGMSVCDGIRTTPWGTILATEEAGASGRAYEILDPLGTTGHWVADRPSGDIRDSLGGTTPSATIAQRPRLGSFSWEGIGILPSGVLYAGDELRPDNGNEGGAIFKYIPSSLRSETAGNISNLADSPFVAGNLYAWVGGSGSGETGQGTQRGQGRWIGPVDWDDVNNPNDKTSRQWARDNNATGFYRPEDLHQDLSYTGTGVRIYWTDTGNSGSGNWAETLSMVDDDPNSSTSRPVVQTFVEGNGRFNSHDNLEIQPQTGMVYVIEDDTFGEIWACLPDGGDENLQTDGCVSILSVIDPSAEPTGFIFDGTGTRAFVNIQHGEQPSALLDFESNRVNGQTDDLLMIEGFTVEGIPGKFPAWTADLMIRTNSR